MAAQRYLVSTSGQMSLPAAARRRWGLERGGPVSVTDFGFAIMVTPDDGVGHFLDQWMSEEEYHHAVATDDDPDLRTT